MTAANSTHAVTSAQAPLPFFGGALRDAGMASVLEHSGDWKEQAIAVIGYLSRRLHRFTSDDVRCHMEATGLPCPPHHNAYGAAMSAAARRGLIVKTGEYIKSCRVKAHSRVVPVWRSAP